MGLKECVIFFDNPYNTYYAGQTVNGRVEFTFDSPKKVRGVYIKFKGESNTSWSVEESRTDNENRSVNERIELTGHEEYFKIQYYLVGGQGSGETVLPIGKQVFPFTCVLPPTLPSSFEGDLGHVRYTVKVVLDRPWKFDQETKVAFTVLSPVDLNANASLRNPARITLEKYFCCCWCKSGPLTVVVSLACTGYAPGQTMTILAEIDNISNVEVLSVEFAFRKIVTYYTRTPRSETKKDIIVLEKIQVGPVPAHESKTYSQPMILPPLPPSNLTNCSLIDLDYELYIEAKVDGFHSNLSSKIPITVGTVPLTGLMGAPLPSAPPPDYAAVNTQEGGNIGWAHGSPQGPPPTYSESQFGTNNIQDSGDNQYTQYNNSNYKPMYPVFNFANPN